MSTNIRSEYARNFYNDMKSALRGRYSIDNETLTLHKIGWIKCNSMKVSQLRDVVHRIRAPYFILKRDRFLTTAIFIDSASTVHNLLKISKFEFLMLSRL